MSVCMKRKILIIDDDKDLSMIVQDMLEDYGYQTALALSAEEAYEKMAADSYHLILLDINLPESSGFEVCQELRKVSTVPIIFASARTSENDKVTGLDMGADDYLAKPYSLKELLSRVNSLLRRTYGFSEEGSTYYLGENREICISTVSRSVTRRGETVSLSLKEFDLLVCLAAHMNESMSKETLLQEVWGTFCEVELSTVAVHIRWLREKLEEEPSHPKLIKTVWGIGYMLVGGTEG